MTNISKKSTKKDGIEGRLEFASIILLSVSVFLAAVLFAISLYLGFAFFWNFRSPSSNVSEWASFATVFGFIAQVIMGVATISAALMVSYSVTRKLEKQKLDNEKRNELIRLSEKMVDHEFYMKVMYPAWEVSLKWFGISGEDGDSYKAQVVCGETRLPKIYRSSEGELALTENHVRNHPHFLPYDVPFKRRRTSIINELSESLALATWIRFWQHVAFLIEKEMIEGDDAVSLFREWYMWWAPFMTEFVAVVEAVIKRVHPDENGLERYLDTLAIRRIRDLHGLMGISPFLGHDSEDKFNEYVSGVTDRLMPIINSSIDQSRNNALFDFRSKTEYETDA